MNESQNKQFEGKDSRYFPRWQVKNPVIYRLGNDERLHQARTQDISCAGMSLLGDEPLLQDGKLKMRVYLFDETSVEVEGRPVWSQETPEGHLTGIQFHNTDVKTQDMILKYAFEIKNKDVVKHWFEGWNRK